MGTFNGLMSKQFPTNLEHRKRQFMPASPTGTIEKNVPTGTVLILGQESYSSGSSKNYVRRSKNGERRKWIFRLVYNQSNNKILIFTGINTAEKFPTVFSSQDMFEATSSVQ